MRRTASSRWSVAVLLAAGMTSACTTAAISTPAILPPVQESARVAHPPTTTSIPTTTTVAPTTTTTTLPARPPQALTSPCELESGTAPPLRGDAVTVSVELAHSLVCSATDVVVARPDGGDHPSRAAQQIGAPLVFAHPDRPYDPASLGAGRVWTDDPALVIQGRHAILPLPSEVAGLPPMVKSIRKEGSSDEVVRRSIESAAPSSSLVIVSPAQPELGRVAAAAAQLVDATAVWSQPGDMRRRRRLAPLAEASRSRLLVGDFSPGAAWQTDVLAAGHQLPGGGQILFPGKRLVALYGHPHTPALGVLGEQPVDQAIARAAELADLYATDDTTVVPTFEIIATTATAGAGSDGDFSSELTVEDLRPWVEAAGRAGYYVVLDLQPGRTDFLTQARRYEELLRLPHVGLALDPEWRLAPNGFHLRAIGSVTAEEVNTVARWLADLVRKERLPQKLLLLHQFKLTMIAERAEIETPPELAVVIQMDGQGPLGTKYDTWNALLAADDRNWLWGWKNFFDEDSPTPTPEHVFQLDPDPVFVSYQ